METKEIYYKITASDKTYKPLILSWLSEVFNYRGYPHDYKDQWINWSIYGGQLSISFDDRSEGQRELVKIIHPRFMGVPQYQTLRVVNKDSFYLDIHSLLSIEYPKITSHTLLRKTPHEDGDGDIFYTYDWRIYLDDGTSIHHQNQRNIMTLKHGEYSYKSIIDERAFINFLNSKFDINERDL